MLGYGLVALPKKLWKLADYKLQAQHLEWKASETRELLDEHTGELSKHKAKIKAFRAQIDNDLETQIILDKIWVDVRY
jgi:chromosome segregation ATPase